MQPVPEHRRQLQEELDRRARINPGYSLRAFARDLRIAPSRLSEVLNGRRGVSEAVAAGMVERLRWQGRRRERFLASVAAHHGRSAARRASAAARLAELRALGPASEYVVAWYGAALRVLSRVRGYRPDRAWAARRLGLTPEQVHRLRRYLRRTGFVDAEDRPTTPDRRLRVHPGQALARAAAALDDPATLVTTDALALHPDDLPAVREHIARLHAELAELSARTEDPQRVALLTTALWLVDHPEEEP